MKLFVKSEVMRTRMAVLCIFLLITVIYAGCTKTPRSQDELNADLYEAVKVCDVEKVRALLDEGAHTDIKGTVDNMVISLDALIGSTELLLKIADGVPNEKLRPEQKFLIDAGATMEKCHAVRLLLSEARKQREIQ